ncbi:RDD family protein [Vulgatibacter sp.]|uniref:RDD family protein n=1 Tax=Vulgatibacter sp. TaxID=1971226 RepID=UPI003569039E
MPLPDEQLVQRRPVGEEVPLDRRGGRRDGARAAAPAALAVDLSIDRRLVPRLTAAVAPPERAAKVARMRLDHEGAEALAGRLLVPLAQSAARALEPAFVAAKRAVSERMQRQRDDAGELLVEGRILEADGEGIAAFVAFGRALLAAPLDASPVRALERLAAAHGLRLALADLYDLVVAETESHPSSPTLRRRGAQLRELGAAQAERVETWEAARSAAVEAAAAGPRAVEACGVAPSAPLATSAAPAAEMPALAARVAEDLTAPAAEELATPVGDEASAPLVPALVARATAAPAVDRLPVGPSVVPLLAPVRTASPSPLPVGAAMESAPRPAGSSASFGAEATPEPLPPFVPPPLAAAPVPEPVATAAVSSGASDGFSLAAAPSPVQEQDDASISARRIALGRSSPDPADVPVQARLLAWIVDLAVVGAVPAVAVVAGTSAFSRPGLSVIDHLLYAAAQHPSIFVAAALLGLLTAFVYLTLGLAIGGRTLGDRLAGLRSVEVEHGTPPGLRLAAVRSAVAIAGTLAFFVSPLWALVDPNGEALHDKVVGTRTIRCV